MRVHHSALEENISVYNAEIYETLSFTYSRGLLISSQTNEPKPLKAFRVSANALQTVAVTP